MELQKNTSVKRISAVIMSILFLVFSIVPVAVHADDAELVIDDTSYSLDTLLASNPGVSSIKIASNNLGTGNAVIPSTVTSMQGWQVKTFFDSEGEKTRYLGLPKKTGETLTFASGCKTTVRNIIFDPADEESIAISKGASVVFENCTFNKTIVNNGAATFSNCTFTTGKINNNGTAEYTGTTVEPANAGTPAEVDVPLSLTLTDSDLDQAVVGRPYDDSAVFQIGGTNKDKASVSAAVSPEGTGLSASVEAGKVIVSGTPARSGDVEITVTASADGEDPVSKTMTIKVSDALSLSIEGTLDCVTKGQSGYQKYLKLYVTEGSKKVSYNNYSASGDAKLTVTMKKADGSVNDSGMNASWLYDSIVVSGTPESSGTYLITAELKDKGQTVTSNAAELRIYNGDETLKGQLAKLPSGTAQWDMEPYEIWTSDGAVIPTTLKNVYGSHESGLYGQIGNNGSVGTDTITIPSGCNVTFENMKFNSSVKLVVEKGGSLTLSDSVAFGQVIVNGGTLTMKNSSAVTDVITLNDGSTLKDSEIVSHHTYLTDGSQYRIVPTVVIVNGTVHASGNNTITGDDGTTSMPGQNGIQVNGTLIIDENSVLSANGGGKSGNLYGAGGDGVILNNGAVTGPGTLVANGGVGVDADGGTGISGKGRISTATLKVHGGNSEKVLIGGKKGGDAASPEVAVLKTTNVAEAAGGSGSADGLNGSGALNIQEPGDPADSGSGKIKNVKTTTTMTVGNRKTPTTGDGSEVLFWFVIAGAASAACAGMAYKRRAR